jgi:hypothetical protein
MSAKKMADVFYAVLMCDAHITSIHHFGQPFTRKQNTYNQASIMMNIEESQLSKFEELAGLELKVQYPLQVNTSNHGHERG